jgi:hypothetical protein
MLRSRESRLFLEIGEATGDRLEGGERGYRRKNLYSNTGVEGHGVPTWGPTRDMAIYRCFFSALVRGVDSVVSTKCDADSDFYEFLCHTKDFRHTGACQAPSFSFIFRMSSPPAPISNCHEHYTSPTFLGLLTFSQRIKDLFENVKG